MKSTPRCAKFVIRLTSSHSKQTASHTQKRGHNGTHQAPPVTPTLVDLESRRGMTEYGSMKLLPALRSVVAKERAALVFEIREDDLSGAATRDLVALHLAAAHANSPPGSVFALDLSGLQVPEITVWSAWHGDNIAAIGALKEHDQGFGELKSMRTHPNYLRQGAASFLLDFIIVEARRRGLKKISLETGSGPAFEPALALYYKRGFVDGASFGDYTRSSFNQFLHLQL